MIPDKAEELLEELIYCDLRTSIGADKARKAIRKALRSQSAAVIKMVDIERSDLADLASEKSKEWLLEQAIVRANYYWKKIDGNYSIANCDPQTKQIIEYVLAAGV